jgi:integrase
LESTGFAVTRGDFLTLAVVGMSACLGAVVWAPVTGILIVFEMTQEFSYVPALMLGALVSQTIARRMNAHNFYDALLEQDGHRIEHVRPPRDLQSWEQFPVSAIANFQPVIISSLAETELRKVLTTHPYRQFPVVLENKLQGVLTRDEAEKSLTEKRAVKLKSATVCMRDQTIGRLQQLAYMLPLYAGLRRNEVKTLRWSNLVLGDSGGLLRIHAAVNKNRKEQALPLHRELTGRDAMSAEESRILEKSRFL